MKGGNNMKQCVVAYEKPESFMFEITTDVVTLSGGGEDGRPAEETFEDMFG